MQVVASLRKVWIKLQRCEEAGSLKLEEDYYNVSINTSRAVKYIKYYGRTLNGAAGELIPGASGPRQAHCGFPLSFHQIGAMRRPKSVFLGSGNVLTQLISSIVHVISMDHCKKWC